MDLKNKGSRKLTKLNQIEAFTIARDNLVEMYKTDSGKKFVHHLIYAFTSGKNVYVLFSKNPLFDCLTKSQLESVYNESRPVNNDEVNNKLTEYKSATEEQKVQIANDINKIIMGLISNNPIPRLAVRSELTDKILGVEELQALTEFIKDQIQVRNKTIYNMVKYAQSLNVTSTERKKSTQPKVTKSIDKRKTIGGDNELRSKLESVLKNG